MRKRILSILVCLCLVCSLIPTTVLAVENPAEDEIAVIPFDQGSVNPPRFLSSGLVTFDAAAPEAVNGVYQLSSADDLVWFAEQVNSGVGTAYNAVLLNDIDMTGVIEWTAIGGGQYNYTGIFDGGNYRITNWALTATNPQFVGLFGKVTGTIQNLTMDKTCSVTVTVTDDFASNIWIASMICVTRAGSVIENCHNEANYTVHAVGATQSSAITACVGGVLGQHSGKAIGCTNSGTISYTTQGGEAYTGTAFVGGAISRNYNGDVTDCTNTGAVAINATGGKKTMTVYAGGVAGISSYSNGAGSMTNCKNEAPITTTTTGIVASSRLVTYTGGVAGSGSSSVSGCVNTGNVQVTLNYGTQNAYAGGVIGNTSTNAVENCRNEGMVTLHADQLESDNLYPSLYVGGITGNSSANTIGGCINESTGVITGKATNIHGISADLSVGGITGSKSSGLIENCKNHAAVSATGSVGTDAPSVSIGGIVGDNSSETVENCSNDGSVTLTATGDMVGYIGGTAGYCSTGSLKDCINSGSVRAVSTDKKSKFYAGGIAASAVTNSSAHVMIEDVSNIGPITVTGAATGYIGGVLGYSYCSGSYFVQIFNSQNDGAVNTVESSSGTLRIGGIAGNFEGKIYNSRNGAEVKGSGSSSYLGGFVGLLDDTSSEIINCYTSGTVSNASMSTNAKPIAGLIYGGKISNSYAFDDAGTVAFTGNYYSNCDSFTSDQTVSYHGAAEKIPLLDALNTRAKEFNQTTIYEWRSWNIDSTSGYPVHGDLFSDGIPQTEYQTVEGGEWLIGSFAKALNSVYAGGTIRLLQDIELTDPLVLTRDVTLTSKDAANPKMITSTVDGHEHLLYLRGGKIVLKDIYIDGGYKEDGTGVTSKDPLIILSGTSTLYIEEGTEIRNNYNTYTKNIGISDQAGGGINVYQGGAVIMNGGAIHSNYAYFGAGVMINSREFTLNGGDIRDNHAILINTYGGTGGGVYVYSGTFNMTGGNIKNNSAENYGGGLYQQVGGVSQDYSLFSKSDVNIIGGTITGNAAKIAAGFYVSGSPYYLWDGVGTFGTTKLSNVEITGNTASLRAGGMMIILSNFVTISSSVNISGNAATEEPQYSDVLLANSQDKVNTVGHFVIESALSEGTKISLDTAWKDTDTADEKIRIAVGTNTYALTKSDYKKFVCTNPDYVLYLDTEENCIWLVERGSVVITYDVDYDLNGGTGAVNVDYSMETVEAGTNVTVKAAPTRDGYTFTGWSDGTTTYQPGETLPVNQDITLTAQWSETTPENPNPNPQPPLIIPPITPAPQPPVTPAPQPPQEDPEHTGNDQVPEVFTDDHYAYIVGVDDGLVHPEDSITRAEVATIFFRLLNEETRAKYLTRENNFTDVSEDDWFCTAASTMAAMGIITGRPGGQFAPYAEITRAEFAAIAARFDDTGDSKDAGFTDIRGNWAEREINIAANRGWVLGYEGKFRPGDSITRAEAMTMVNRVLQRNPESKADLHPDMIQWPDNLDTTRWYYLHVQEATNGHDYRRRENGREYWTALREVPDWAALEQGKAL